jgi:hypothetical protein
MKPYYTLPLVVALVVSATTGLGLALVRAKHNRISTSMRPMPSLSPLPAAADASLPTPQNPTPIMASPAPDPSTNLLSPSDASTKTDLSRPLTLSDDAQPGTAFYQFREQFRQAVAHRDYAFVADLISAQGVSIGFSRPSTAVDLELANPDAEIWAILEKALALGCAALDEAYYPGVDPGSTIWLCPNAQEAFHEQYPNPSTEPGIEYEISHAVIVGDRVNVRTLPDLDSPVIGTLSNEVVLLDREIWERTASAIPEAVWRDRTHPITGWTPILMPDGQPGYVSNRYVYQPLAPKLLLGQVNGQWQILRIPAGD